MKRRTYNLHSVSNLNILLKIVKFAILVNFESSAKYFHLDQNNLEFQKV